MEPNKDINGNNQNTVSLEQAATYEVEDVKLKKKKKEKTGKKPLVPTGTLIQNKYEVIGMIGSGGYGQIYKAIIKDANNPNSGNEVAIKLMVKDQEPQRMVLEQKVLRELKGAQNMFPKLYGSGQLNGNQDLQFLVMDLLGPNLSELRKMRPLKKFPVVTVLQIGLQCIRALQIVHKLGYVHRDIKPANLCRGRTSDKINRDHVYIVDFGLARQSKDNKGRYITRTYAGFRGTLRYVSVNVHERKDQCAVDDLVCLYYSLCEMADGSLPWARYKDQDQVFRYKKAAGVLSKHLPEIFSKFYDTLIETPNPHEPDYDQLNEWIMKCAPSQFDKETVDWADRSGFSPPPVVKATSRSRMLAPSGPPTESDNRSIFNTVTARPVVTMAVQPTQSGSNPAGTQTATPTVQATHQGQSIQQKPEQSKPHQRVQQKKKEEKTERSVYCQMHFNGGR